MTKISTVPPMKDADKLAALRKLERNVKAADRLVESCSESLKAAKEERSVAIERLRTAVTNSDQEELFPPDAGD